MVSIAAVSSSAQNDGAKPPSAAELSSEINKLRIRKGDYRKELKELELLPIKDVETYRRISELRDLIRETQKQIDQRQVLLDALKAEKQQKKSGDAQAGETSAAAKSEEKNPYARLFKTDLSVLGEAAKAVTRNAAEIINERGTRPIMSDTTVAAALLVTQDTAKSATPRDEVAGEVVPGEAPADPTASVLNPLRPASDEDGQPADAKADGQVGAGPAEDGRTARRGERRSLRDRLEEIAGR